MPNDETHVAILFAVVCGSARLYETLGDEGAHRRIAGCAGAMAATISARGGRVVKTADAELLAVLPGADSAYLAAFDMMDEQWPGGLPVRIGFHVGPVIENAGDVFGDTVNLAARIAAMARPGETLITDDAVRGLSAPHREGTRLLDRETTVRGKSAPITVHEIALPDQDMTVMGGFAASPRQSEARLLLAYKDRRLSVGGHAEMITIGRVDENDLTIPDTAVSRRHATIEGRRGHFEITDISTNGTYVHADGRAPLLLKREKLQLTGSGSISLGRTPETNSENLLRFKQASD